MRIDEIRVNFVNFHTVSLLEEEDNWTLIGWISLTLKNNRISFNNNIGTAKGSEIRWPPTEVQNYVKLTQIVFYIEAEKVNKKKNFFHEIIVM